jgi:hypothetical protein
MIKDFPGVMFQIMLLLLRSFEFICQLGRSGYSPDIGLRYHPIISYKCTILI